MFQNFIIEAHQGGWGEAYLFHWNKWLVPPVSLIFKWSGMKAPAAPTLPSQNCRARNLISYFSLNNDTWIYICYVILLLELNAITRHKYYHNNQNISEFINGHFWQANWYECHSREFRLFYRFAWNKTYLRIHYHYQLMENTNSDACVILYSIKLFTETLYKTDFMHSCVDIHLLKIDCNGKQQHQTSTITKISI